MRFLKPILRKRLFAQDDESRSMWSNSKCGFIKLPLLRRANRNFWTIWSKLSNKRGCFLGKTFRFGAMGRFSFLAFSSSALYMAQNPLTVLSLTGRLFDSIFFAAAVGPLMAAYFLIVNLSWLSFLTFWVRNSWNSNFEIEGTQTWFILQILRWYYGRIFHVLNFMKNYSNPKIFFEFQKKKWKCKMFYFQSIFLVEAYLLLMCVSLESCYHDFMTLFAGRYRNYNSVVIWSLSLDIFESFVYVMLRNSKYFINFRIPFEDTILT